MTGANDRGQSPGPAASLARPRVDSGPRGHVPRVREPARETNPCATHSPRTRPSALAGGDRLSLQPHTSLWDEPTRCRVTGQVQRAGAVATPMASFGAPM